MRTSVSIQEALKQRPGSGPWPRSLRAAIEQAERSRPSLGCSDRVADVGLRVSSSSAACGALGRAIGLRALALLSESKAEALAPRARDGGAGHVATHAPKKPTQALILGASERRRRFLEKQAARQAAKAGGGVVGATPPPPRRATSVESVVAAALRDASAAAKLLGLSCRLWRRAAREASAGRRAPPPLPTLPPSRADGTRPAGSAAPRHAAPLAARRPRGARVWEAHGAPDVRLSAALSAALGPGRRSCELLSSACNGGLPALAGDGPGEALSGQAEQAAASARRAMCEAGRRTRGLADGQQADEAFLVELLAGSSRFSA